MVQLSQASFFIQWRSLEQDYEHNALEINDTQRQRL